MPQIRGKQPRNRLPREENERIITETIRRLRGQPVPLSLVEGGGAGAGGGLPLAVYTPTYIGPGQTFVVPENTQVLWSVSIIVDGAIQVDGAFVQVG